MRIGIDARALTGRYTGDRTYWLNLVRAYIATCGEAPDTEYVLYSRLPIPPGTLPECTQIRARTVPANNDRIWTMLVLPKALKQDGVDLAHTQYTTPLRPPCPVITTVHDISFRIYPEWFTRKHRLLLNMSVPGSMRRAEFVITDSQSSRRDILRIYRLPETKVLAIPLAAAPEYSPMDKGAAQQAVRETYGIQGPFVLAVSVLQPRKNLPTLMEGFALAREVERLPHKLVITGKRGWLCNDLDKQAARLDVADHLIYTDYVPDQDLPALYSACDVMAYPSLYEGFGLPPLEAMACGAPTMVSDAPAMPEVVGDGAMVVPVMDPGAWAEGLAYLLHSACHRERLRQSGLKRAACYSWEQTARRTRQVYDTALNAALHP